MFHSRLCLLNEGAAPRELPQFWPKKTMRRYETNSIVSWNKWDSARGTRRWLSCLAVLAPRFKRYAYPLPAYCLLIAYSGALATIRILSEMRLDYSPIHAGFAYKTTKLLWHWRALLRCIVCSQDDAVLVLVELLVPVWCSGNCGKRCTRKLHKLVRRHARVVRTVVVRLSDECVRLSFERRGTVLCVHLPASVCTAAANYCHLRAGCCRTCAWAGARRVARCTARLRFELRDQSAPLCVQCGAWMRVKCTRLPIPVATRMRS